MTETEHAQWIRQFWKDKLDEIKGADRMTELEIVEKPFDWNDNFSEIALEDFSMIQKSLPYCTCQTIGMALAKLKLLEKRGCKVKGEEQTDAT